MSAEYAATGTVSTLTEDQAIGLARLAVKHQVPGWQAFEVLLRMVDAWRRNECHGCRDGHPTRSCFVTGRVIHRGSDGAYPCANGGK